MIRFILSLLALCLPGMVSAGSFSATPTTLYAVLARARAGDAITLMPGNYGTVAIVNRRWAAPGVRIDAQAGRFDKLVLRGLDGLTLYGGTIWGSPIGSEIGVNIDSVRHVRVEGLLIGGARTGLSVMRSAYVEVVGNRFDGVRSDGVNVTSSRWVAITGNACVSNRPIMPIFDSQTGSMTRDGDHPDCIQGWNTVGYPALADLTIENNTAHGYMQGVMLNSAVAGGGYNRVTIRHNRFRLAMFQGILLEQGRQSSVTENIIEPIPGARFGAGPSDQPVKPWIKVVGGDVRVCGNIVTAWPNGEGTQQC